MMPVSSVDQKAINTIRMLSADAVEKAQSGHPGMPMGAAPFVYVLWAKHMRHDPSNPGWINRDRFVLSAGHGSMLLYSLLHLFGYGLPISEIKKFRQWESLTPGHPEVKHTPGVDASTGPLGQGMAMAVGMAMAEAHLGAVYNRNDFNIIDHYTYCICGDGDLMEGVSNEAASLAGHLKLSKLIVLYDSNNISLDGELSLSFSENIQTRFEALGWGYLRVDNENDLEAISHAIQLAKEDQSRPTLIEVKTTIGFGSPNKAGKGGANGPHGKPLGKEELALTKQALGWPLKPDFYVPEDVKKHFSKLKSDCEQANRVWSKMVHIYKSKFPDLAKQLDKAIKEELEDQWDVDLKPYSADQEPISTRKASYDTLQCVSTKAYSLIGGSADLESSTFTHLLKGSVFSSKNYSGRNIYFGVREFAMASAINGMMLHEGVKVFGGTFLVFSDYMRPAIRLAAIMKVPSIFVFTHDSIAVGEDGPTHQPIEQLTTLRAIPNVTVIRPADGNETQAAWKYALLNNHGPICLILSRQNLPILKNTEVLAWEGITHGAYILADSIETPKALILATGSEVSLAMDAKKMLSGEGIGIRVISIPSWEIFEQQSKEYKDSIILPHVKVRLAIEMASPFGWERYVGSSGVIMGINEFGKSGKSSHVIHEFGFTVQNVVSQIKNMLNRVD